ncbi:MAG: DUF998 domain-containing protein [Chloroflexi bacterium]|nr:DUF998 domain-containing protein [Chloroflexota bacterium]
MGNDSGNRFPAIGRWLIVALATFYLAVVYGGASLKTQYSHLSQYISELNAVDTAWSWQIGYLGFVPLGLFGLVLLLIVEPRARLSGISRIGCWLLIAEPIAYVGSALAPCDLGCPSTGSLSQNVHNILSAITLVVTTAGLVLLYFNRTIPLSKRAGWLVLATTFIVLYSLALVPDFAIWRGLLQRLAEAMLYGSLCLVSWRLLGIREKATPVALDNQDGSA